MKRNWTHSTWNRRYKEMTEIVHTQEGRVEIIEFLTYLKGVKDLSFGERKLLDLAQNYEERMKEYNANVIRIDAFTKKDKS